LHVERGVTLSMAVVTLMPWVESERPKILTAKPPTLTLVSGRLTLPPNEPSLLR